METDANKTEENNENNVKKTEEDNAVPKITSVIKPKIKDPRRVASSDRSLVWHKIHATSTRQGMTPRIAWNLS